MSDRSTGRDPDRSGNQAVGLAGFGRHFKRYMSVMPVAMAAFAPVFTLLKGIPVYAQQSRTLAGVSAVIGFLMLCWVYAARHILAVAFFSSAARKLRTRPEERSNFSAREKLAWFGLLLAPLLMITLSGIFFYRYEFALEASITRTQATLIMQQFPERHDWPTLPEEGLNYFQIVNQCPPDKIPKRDVALAQTSFEVPYGGELLIRYLAIFFFAEIAFLTLALREYLQDALGLTDIQIINSMMYKGRGAEDA